MVIRIEDLKELSNKILMAVDNSGTSEFSGKLQLKTIGNTLTLIVATNAIYVRVKFEMDSPMELNTTVDAGLFLKLISQMTSETVEFESGNNCLVVKGNGEYKIPVITDDGGNVLELPEIKINNVTSNFNIHSDILNSIYLYNSKMTAPPQKGGTVKRVQEQYYVDDKGAITSYNSICVNSFTLEKPVRLLFKSDLVKLFKIFKGGDVNFSLGYDALSDETIQTKVSFETDDVLIAAIISCDDNTLNSMPVVAFRERAFAVYPYSINVNKSVLMPAIRRLSLFNQTDAIFNFGTEKLTISIGNSDCSEEIYYDNKEPISGTYTNSLDLTDVILALDNCSEQFVTMSFGNNENIVVSRGNIYNIVAELGE